MVLILAETNRVLIDLLLVFIKTRPQIVGCNLGVIAFAAKTRLVNMVGHSTKMGRLLYSNHTDTSVCDICLHLSPVGSPYATANSSQSIFIASWPMSVNQSSLKYKGAVVPACPGIDVGSMIAGTASVCATPGTPGP